MVACSGRTWDLVLRTYNLLRSKERLRLFVQTKPILVSIASVDVCFRYFGLSCPDLSVHSVVGLRKKDAKKWAL